MFNFSSVSESFAGKLHNHRVGLRALRGGRTREGAPPLLKTSRVGGQDDPSARARGRERYRGLPYVLAAVNATRVRLLICLECVSTVPVALHSTALHPRGTALLREHQEHTKGSTPSVGSTARSLATRFNRCTCSCAVEVVRWQRGRPRQSTNVRHVASRMHVLRVQ